MTTVEDILEHHGIKGQKWGIRRDPRTGVRPIANTLDKSAFGRLANRNVEKHNARQLKRADKKWQKNIYSSHSAIAFHNSVARKVNADLPAFNAKYHTTDVRPGAPASAAYERAFEQLIVKHAKSTAIEVYGTSPSGNMHARYSPQHDQIVIFKKLAAHAATEPTEYKIDVVVEDGKIVALKQIKTDAMQSSMVDEFLEHHGIKGQKWGIRRDRRTGVRPIANTLDKSAFGRLANRNVEKHNARQSKRSASKSRVSKPRSADSRKVSELKKKHVSQLTNKQLKTIQERHNLEQSLKKANPKKIEKGHNFAKGLVAVGSTATALYGLSQSPLFKHAVKLGRTFINVQFSGKFANSRKIDVTKFPHHAQGKLF